MPPSGCRLPGTSMPALLKVSAVVTSLQPLGAAGGETPGHADGTGWEGAEDSEMSRDMCQWTPAPTSHAAQPLLFAAIPLY